MIPNHIVCVSNRLAVNDRAPCVRCANASFSARIAALTEQLRLVELERHNVRCRFVSVTVRRFSNRIRFFCSLCSGSKSARLDDLHEIET